MNLVGELRSIADATERDKVALDPDFAAGLLRRAAAALEQKGPSLWDLELDRRLHRVEHALDIAPQGRQCSFDGYEHEPIPDADKFVEAQRRALDAALTPPPFPLEEP